MRVESCSFVYPNISAVLAYYHSRLTSSASAMTVGIQVSSSARDKPIGMAPFSAPKYSRTSLYITGHLPHLDKKVTKQPFLSYLSTMTLCANCRVGTAILLKRKLGVMLSLGTGRNEYSKELTKLTLLF